MPCRVNTTDFLALTRCCLTINIDCSSITQFSLCYIVCCLYVRHDLMEIARIAKKRKKKGS